MRRLTATLLLLGVAGCGSDAVRLALPSLEGAESIVVVAQGDERSVNLAADLETLGSVSFDAPADDLAAMSIHLFGFECALDRLGLVPGQDLPRPTEPKMVPLPRHRFELTSGLGDSTQVWTPVESVSDAIESSLPLDLAPAGPCVSFDRRIERVSPDAIGLHSSVTLPEGDVFLTGDLCFRVGRERIEEVVNATVCKMRTEFVDEDGDVWLSALDGSIAHGHPDRGFARFPADDRIPLPSGLTSARDIGLSGSIAGGSLELFAIIAVGGGPTSSDGAITIEWFHGGRWQNVLEPTPVRFGGPPVVQWLSPGRAVFGSAAHDGVVYVQEGRFFQQELPTEALDRPNTFSRHARWEVVIGTRGGAIVGGSPGAWSLLRPSSVALGSLPVSSIVPFEDGMAFTDTRSDVWQWYETDEGCRPARALLDGVQGTIEILPLHDRLLGRPSFSVPGDDQARNGEIHIMERVPRDPCVLDAGDRGMGWDE